MSQLDEMPVQRFEVLPGARQHRPAQAVAGSPQSTGILGSKKVGVHAANVEVLAGQDFPVFVIYQPPEQAVGRFFYFKKSS